MQNTSSKHSMTETRTAELCGTTPFPSATHLSLSDVIKKGLKNDQA